MPHCRTVSAPPAPGWPREAAPAGDFTLGQVPAAAAKSLGGADEESQNNEAPPGGRGLGYLPQRGRSRCRAQLARLVFSEVAGKAAFFTEPFISSMASLSWVSSLASGGT